MTTVAVLADPPRPGFVLADLAETSPLSETEAADLYAAALGDACRAVERSGGELLVNYRADEDVPPEVDDSEAAIRDVLDDALESPSEARYEVQVGSTPYARVGNTVTHLLEREGVKTAAVVDPTAAFLTRATIDSAAMKLRTSEVVVGPATEGRFYYAGFAEPIDFTDALASPAIETLTDRARGADLAVDFLPTLPLVETGGDLLTAIPNVRARRRADRRFPERTAAALDRFGLRVRSSPDGPTVEREE